MSQQRKESKSQAQKTNKFQILSRQKSIMEPNNPNMESSSMLQSDMMVSYKHRIRSQSFQKKINKLYEAKEIDLFIPEHSEGAIYILQKTSKLQQDIKFIQKMMKNLTLFKDKQELLDIPPENYISKLQVQKYPKHHVLFKRGEMGSTYYIVLKGCCYLVVPKQEQEPDMIKETEQQEESESNNNISNSHVMAQSKISNYLDSPRDDIHDFLKLNFPREHIPYTFKNGEGFGEIALMSRQKRTATIVCGSNTVLLSLTKDGYQSIMGEYHQRIVMSKIMFFQQFNFLKSVPYSYMVSLLLHNIKSIECLKGQVIYQENDHDIQLYFIKEGEIKLTKLVHIDNQNEGQQSALNILQKPPTKKQHSLLKCKQTRYGQQKQQENKRVDLCLLGPNQYFGEYELVRRHQTRQTKAEIISHKAKLISVNKKRFLNILDYFAQVQVFIEEAQQKNKFLDSREQYMKKEKDDILLNEQINQDIHDDKTTFLDFIVKTNNLEKLKNDATLAKDSNLLDSLSQDNKQMILDLQRTKKQFHHHHNFTSKKASQNNSFVGATNNQTNDSIVQYSNIRFQSQRQLETQQSVDNSILIQDPHSYKNSNNITNNNSILHQQQENNNENQIKENAYFPKINKSNNNLNHYKSALNSPRKIKPSLQQKRNSFNNQHINFQYNFHQLPSQSLNISQNTGYIQSQNISYLNQTPVNTSQQNLHSKQISLDLGNQQQQQQNNMISRTKLSTKHLYTNVTSLQQSPNSNVILDSKQSYISHSTQPSQQINLQNQHQSQLYQQQEERQVSPRILNKNLKFEQKQFRQAQDLNQKIISNNQSINLSQIPFTTKHNSINTSMQDHNNPQQQKKQSIFNYTINQLNMQSLNPLHKKGSSKILKQENLRKVQHLLHNVETKHIKENLNVKQNYLDFLKIKSKDNFNNLPTHHIIKTQANQDKIIHRISQQKKKNLVSIQNQIPYEKQQYPENDVDDNHIDSKRIQKMLHVEEDKEAISSYPKERIRKYLLYKKRQSQQFPSQNNHNKSQELQQHTMEEQKQEQEQQQQNEQQPQQQIQQQNQ